MRFLASLECPGRCDDEALVLPSHGRPFRRLHVRLAGADGRIRFCAPAAGPPATAASPPVPGDGPSGGSRSAAARPG